MEITSVQASAPSMLTVPAPAAQNAAENRELILAVQALNEAELFGQNNELTFVLDPETHRPLVRIINRKTNEVIRQIPPEYALRMAEDLKREGF